MIIRDTSGNTLGDTSSDAFLDLRNLRNANFRGQHLEVLDLSDKDLTGADFTDADLYWTYLFRANCEGAIFRNCRLSGAVLDGANLRRADFTGAYVSYDNLLGGSSLIEADLTDALLDGVDLKGSKYNRLTIFPHGFDPKANGMLEVNEEQGLVVPTGSSPIEKNR